MADGGLDKLSPQQKEELMKNVQTQVALANMQELLTVRFYLCNFRAFNIVMLYSYYLAIPKKYSVYIYAHLLIFQKITDKCFKKCFGNPGSSFSSSDQVQI